MEQIVLFDDLTRESFQPGRELIFPYFRSKIIRVTSTDSGNELVVELDNHSIRIPFPIPPDMHHFIKGVIIS